MFTIKLIVVILFFVSAVYVHLRGKVRHKITRQIGDHSTFLAPINCVMYLSSSVPNTPYISVQRFPEMQVLDDRWEEIREEAKHLLDMGLIRASDQYNDAGFNSFFKTGWKRFYLKWYGTNHPSAEELCPKTVALLRTIPSVKAAMFAALPPGGRLVRHRDPYAGSLRYHLGLITPNDDKCFIDVDGEKYSWRDGKSIIFDETFIHYAENATDKDRIILFCDLERPLMYRWAEWLNRGFSQHVMSAAAAPNQGSDSTGGINRAFKYLYQVRLVGKRLKKWNRTVYYAVKIGLFGGLVYLILC